MILPLVYKSTQENYEMVTTDYYKKEQLHQGKIDGAQRVKSQNQAAQCLVNHQGVQIIFPSSATANKKEIEIYCPANQARDQQLTTSENAIAIGLKAGKYQLKMSWKKDGLDYYQEKWIWIKS